MTYKGISKMLSINPVNLKEGFVLRAATLDDAPGVLDLVKSCDVKLTGQSEESLDGIVGEWQSPGMNLETDIRVISARDGRLVGSAIVLDANRPVTPIIDVYVHPDYWDGSLDDYLMTWAEQR